MSDDMNGICVNSNVADRGSQLGTALRDTAEWIHLRLEYRVALPTQVSGYTVKVVYECRQSAEVSEAENAVRQYDCFRHCMYL
jgi:hypothetical protein